MCDYGGKGESDDTRDVPDSRFGVAAFREFGKLFHLGGNAWRWNDPVVVVVELIIVQLIFQFILFIFQFIFIIFEQQW